MTGPYAAQMSVDALISEAIGYQTTLGQRAFALTLPELKRFAALVRAHALEEAARVCEDLSERRRMMLGLECADAIRAIAAAKPESGS